MIKRLYSKILIWYYGKFKNRIVRCRKCSFRVFKNDPLASRQLLRHHLYGHPMTPKEQLDYLESEIKKTREKLLNLLDCEF